MIRLYFIPLVPLSCTIKQMCLLHVQTKEVLASRVCPRPYDICLRIDRDGTTHKVTVSTKTVRPLHSQRYHIDKRTRAHPCRKTCRLDLLRNRTLFTTMNHKKQICYTGNGDKRSMKFSHKQYPSAILIPISIPAYAYRKNSPILPGFSKKDDQIPQSCTDSPI